MAAAAAAAGSHEKEAGSNTQHSPAGQSTPFSRPTASGISCGAEGTHSSASGSGSTAAVGSPLDTSQKQEAQQQQQQQQHCICASDALASLSPAAGQVKAAKLCKGGKNGKRGTAKSHLMCKVDDCRSQLSSSKAYYQRHRVCAAHLAAMSAKVDGVDSRFCQQCGKFQPLTEFDQDKRSCRSRLKRHNNRRREQRQHKGLEFSLPAAGRSDDADHITSAVAAASGSSEQQQDAGAGPEPGSVGYSSPNPSLDNSCTAGPGCTTSPVAAAHTPGDAAAAAAAAATEPAGGGSGGGGMLLINRTHMRRSSAARALQALRSMNAASSHSTASEFEDEESNGRLPQRQQPQRALFSGGAGQGSAAAKRPMKRSGSAEGGHPEDPSRHTNGYSAAAAAASAAHQRFSHPGVLTLDSAASGAVHSYYVRNASYAGSTAAGGSGAVVVSSGGDSGTAAGFVGRTQPALSRFLPHNPGIFATLQYQHAGTSRMVQQPWQQQQQQQWGTQLQQQCQQTWLCPWDQPQPQHYQQRQQLQHEQLQQYSTAFRGPSGVAAAVAAAPRAPANAYLSHLEAPYEHPGPAAALACVKGRAATQMPEQHSAPPELHASESGTFLAHNAAVGGRFIDVCGPGALAAAQGAAAAGVSNAGLPHCWSFPAPYTVQTQQRQQQHCSSADACVAQHQQQLIHKGVQSQQQQQQQQQSLIQQQQQLSTGAGNAQQMTHAGSAPLPRDADVATQSAAAVSPDSGSMSPMPPQQRSHHSSYPGQLPPPPRQQLWPTQAQQQQRRVTGSMQSPGMHVKPDLYMHGSSEGLQQAFSPPAGQPAQLSTTSSSREAQMSSLRAAMQAAAARAGAVAAAAATGAPASTLNTASPAEDMVCSATGSPCIRAAGMLGADLGGINLGPGWKQQQQQPQSSWQADRQLLPAHQQQQLQQLTAFACATVPDGSGDGEGVQSAAAHAQAAVPVAPGYGCTAPGVYAVPESDMLRGMSCAEDDYSELYELLLEGTEQQ